MFARRLSVSRLALLSAGLAFSAAHAADAPAGIEEITVVGQKQETSLQKAPDSITALTSTALEQNNVVNPLDLNGLVPGLVITTSEGYDRSVTIRGVGFNTPQVDSAQPSVSYHEDGIYISNPVALNSGFLDVDHIEVLRGPQGTVFGQNSIGGTVNVISKQPTFDEITGFANFSTGSFDLVHSTAAINLPITSSFAIRAAVDQVYQQGYVHATQVPGSNGRYDLGDQNNYHGRVLALWKPTDDLSIEFRGEHAEAHQHETPGKNIYDPDPNPYQETSDWPGKFTYDQDVIAGTITYDMPFATLKSLSSWQQVNQGLSVNEDGLDLAITGSGTNPLFLGHDVEWFTHDSQSITQELDLTSKPGTSLDWVVGGFYLHSRYKVAYDQYQAFEGDDYTPNLLNQYGNPPQAALDNLYSELVFPNEGVEERRSYSAYGQATYHVLDNLRVSAGVRYSLDRSATIFSEYFLPGINQGQTAEKITYRFAADYDLTPTNLLYASYSTGFKPGGGNLTEYPITVPLLYKPETVTAYEVGSKNSFLDKRLTLNLASFYYKDRNMQFEAEDLNYYQGGVGNVPDVDIYGLEGEITALLPYHLRFDANATAERGKVASHYSTIDFESGLIANNSFINQYGIDTFYGCTFVPASVLFSPACAPLAALRQGAFRDTYGNAPPNMPEFTGTASLSHTLEFGNGSSLLSRVSVTYRDDYSNTIFGKTPLYTVPGYTMFNLYFDYVFPAGTWDASFAVTNLTNQAAILSRFTNQYGGETTQQYAPPREFIARVAYQF
jgi:iron complex outermembrane receptor protein